jgi:hypothetical protein
VLSEVATPGAAQLIRRARPDGQYDMLEFGDMLSRGVSNEASSVVESETAAAAANGIHTHEARRTRFKMADHDAARNGERFAHDTMFVYCMFKEESAALAALMQCAHHGSIEQWLDPLRVDTGQARTARGWLDEVAAECGLHFFCAYVSAKNADAVSLIFNADAVNRFFLVLVVRLEPRSEKPCIALARDTWDKQASEVYEKRMHDTSVARDTHKPCTARFEGEKSHFWACYDLDMCESLAATRLKLQYAYYSACQCVL